MAKRSITYYWGDRSLLIKLGNRMQPRVRALYLIEFIVTSGMATIFLIQSLPFQHKLVNWTAAVGASVLYLLSLYRFLSRSFFSEQIKLDKQSLTLVKKTFFMQQVRRFEWRRIGTLHYEGKLPKTDRSLKGKYLEYFSFDNRDNLIQSLHHDGNLYFDTLNGRVYFAAGVYSWDAEDMVQMMKLYVGSALHLGPEWKEMLQEQE